MDMGYLTEGGTVSITVESDDSDWQQEEEEKSLAQMREKYGQTIIIRTGIMEEEAEEPSLQTESDVEIIIDLPTATPAPQTETPTPAASPTPTPVVIPSALTMMTTALSGTKTTMMTTAGMTRAISELMTVATTTVTTTTVTTATMIKIFSIFFF